MGFPAWAMTISSPNAALAQLNEKIKRFEQYLITKQQLFFLR